MTNYTKYAVKSAGMILIISIIAASLGYLIRLILARNLTLEDFGLFYAVFAFLSMISVFKGLGFDKALRKFIPEFKNNKNDDFLKSSIIYAAGVQLITNTIIIIAVYLLSDFLAVNFFGNTQASIVLKLMAIAFFIDSFVVILRFVFQGFGNMLYFSGVDLVRMSLLTIIIFFGLRSGFGISIPILAYTITPIILLILFSALFVKKIFPKFLTSKFNSDKKLLKRLWKYSKHIILVSAGGMILGYTDIMVLTFFSGLTAVGLYSIALPTTRILIYFARAIAGILIPLSSDLWIKKEKKLLKIGMEELSKYSIIIMVPTALAIFSFADTIINIFFGPNFILAANAMRILSIGMIFHIIYSIYADFLAGIGHPEINSRNISLVAIFNLMGNLILIPIIGLTGAAITTTLSYFIMMVYVTIKIRTFIDIKFPIISWIKTIFIGILFVLSIFFLKDLLNLNILVEAIIILMISGLGYVILLFLMKVINIGELKKIHKRFFFEHSSKKE